MIAVLVLVVVVVAIAVFCACAMRLGAFMSSQAPSLPVVLLEGGYDVFVRQSLLARVFRTFPTAAMPTERFHSVPQRWTLVATATTSLIILACMLVIVVLVLMKNMNLKACSPV